MAWPTPENVTGFASMLTYVADIFPNFPYLALTGFFVIMVMIFNRRSPIPNSVTAAAFITWTCSVFFMVMGAISATVVVFLGVGTAFCILWTRLAQSSSIS